jgi:Flp pilus assembly pilin Flp
MLKPRRLSVVKSVQRFMRDDGAATAVEFALIASGIAVAVAVLGSIVNGLYTGVATAME